MQALRLHDDPISLFKNKLSKLMGWKKRCMVLEVSTSHMHVVRTLCR